MRRLAWLRRFSFRRRLTIAGTVAVAVAIALASAITFLVVSAEMRGQIDDSLRDTAGELSGDQFVLFRRAPAEAARKEPHLALPAPAPGAGTEVQLLPKPGAEERLVAPAPPLGNVRYAQIVPARGRIVRPARGRLRLPDEARARRLARRGSGSFFSDATVEGKRVRVYTQAVTGGGVALQVARPVDELNTTLNRLAGVLAAVTLGGIGLAAGLGLAMTRTVLKPVSDLSAAAEHVAATKDLSRRIESAGEDELSRLAGSFNTMLAALEDSMSRQRQLVADASHELRTPLTSLRTNIEVLSTGKGMSDSDRRRLASDIVGQLEELTGLVGDLVDMAREDEDEGFAADLRLDELVGSAVERARRRHPDRAFELDSEPTLVHGVAPRLDRAIANLIDNADKWGPSGTPVEIVVRDGELTVRDHGPGIAEPDLPLVFERFYRAPSARRLPGSGLGLAIVRQVAESHGGTVAAEPAEGGGALLRLALRTRPRA